MNATNERPQPERCAKHWPETLRLDGSCRKCEPRWACPNCGRAVVEAGTNAMQCVPCELLWPHKYVIDNFVPR